MTQIALIHGFLGEPIDWDPVRERLAPSISTSAPRIPVAESWSDGVTQLAEGIAAGSILVGYSMGARLALSCVMEYPNRFAGLIFVSGNPGLESHVEREARVDHDKKVAERLLTLPFEAFLTQWFRQPVFSSLDETSVAKLCRERNGRDRERHAKLLTTYSVGHQPNYWERLSSCSLPVQVVMGELDSKYVDIGRRMQNELTHCRLEIVPAAGHLVHHDRPTEFTETVRAFTARINEEKTCHDKPAMGKP